MCVCVYVYMYTCVCASCMNNLACAVCECVYMCVFASVNVCLHLCVCVCVFVLHATLLTFGLAQFQKNNVIVRYNTVALSSSAYMCKV